MTTEPTTPDEEYDFYAQPANQEPQGEPRRRSRRLTAPIPVRFPPELLAEVKRRRRRPLGLGVDPARRGT